MFKASRNFIILSLDGSHAVEDRLDEEHATAPSIIDHYLVHPTTVPLTSHFSSFLVNTPCQRHLGQNLLDEANKLW